jgi:ATP-dependent Clp protease ATP-binding subunit ClpC
MSMPSRPFLTTRAHQAFSIAHDLAERLGHEDITPAHVALGVVREGRSVAVAVLVNRGVALAALERELEALLPPPGRPREVAVERVWTPSDEPLIEKARMEARELRTEFFGCEHLLLALLRNEGAVAEVLARHGVHLTDARTEILRIYDTRPE